MKESYGLDVAAVYARVDISQLPSDVGHQLLAVIGSLEYGSILEISMKATDKELQRSSPVGDDAAEAWLRSLLQVAEQRGIRIALYPHVYFWMVRIEDALRLCRRISHPLLGVAFPTFHWYAVDGTGLLDKLTEAAPYLTTVNLWAVQERKISAAAACPSPSNRSTAESSTSSSCSAC